MTNFASIAVEIPEFAIAGRESDGGTLLTDIPMPTMPEAGDWMNLNRIGSMAWITSNTYTPFRWPHAIRMLAVFVGGDYVTAPIPVLPSGTVVLPVGWSLLAIM